MLVERVGIAPTPLGASNRRSTIGATSHGVEVNQTKYSRNTRYPRLVVGALIVLILQPLEWKEFYLPYDRGKL